MSTSGVGVQSRYLAQGLINTGKYTFRCLGGALRHENYDTVKISDDFIIKPTDGFGDKNMLRMLLAVEKPDVLLLFTDPRFFGHIWENEAEIHQICPIAYNHIWDAGPWPEFNRVIYESVDLINCINWPIYDMVHQRFPEKTHYVPHAVPPELFFPMSDTDRIEYKRSFLKDRTDHFVVLYVGRNARRKVPNDVVASFKQFLGELERKEGHRKAVLLMHADPTDPEGPNLHHTIDMLHLGGHVQFSKDRVDFEHMNCLYNISDVLINISLNEGFGLPVLEMKMCGRPVIALKTGGLTRQVVDYLTGEQYGVALEPEVQMLVGNQVCPYIFEDAVSHATVSKAIMTIYEMGPKGREEIGKKARLHALRDYDIKFLISEWDKTLSQLTTDWQAGKRPARWNMIEL